MKVILFSLFTLFTVSIAKAQYTATWLGSTPNWSTPANWSFSPSAGAPSLPDATTNVVINTASFAPVISAASTITIKSLQISSGQMTVSSGAVLNINSDTNKALWMITGQLTIATGATVNIHITTANAAINLNTASTLVNNGTINITQGQTGVYISGQLYQYGTLYINNMTSGSDGIQINGSGQMNMNGSAQIHIGNTAVVSNGIHLLAGGVFNNNQGTISFETNVTDRLLWNDGGTVNNTGTMTQSASTGSVLYGIINENGAIFNHTNPSSGTAQIQFNNIGQVGVWNTTASTFTCDASLNLQQSSNYGIINSATFTSGSYANLYLYNNSVCGIYNTGSFSLGGVAYIQAPSVSTGCAGLVNKNGSFTLTGQLNIGNMATANSEYALTNKSSGAIFTISSSGILSVGVITGTNAKNGLINKDTASFTNNGTIHIENQTTLGIENDAYFTNAGYLALNNCNRGINNTVTFTNSPSSGTLSSQISIDNASTTDFNGPNLINNGTFNNNAPLFIGMSTTSSVFSGIYNKGGTSASSTFTNTSLIQVKKCTFGIRNVVSTNSAVFDNKSQIILDSLSTGVFNSSVFKNDTLSSLSITKSTASSGESISQTLGSFYNGPCGHITMDQKVNLQGGVLLNDGVLYTSNTSTNQHANTAGISAFVNRGLIVDANGTFPSASFTLTPGYRVLLTQTHTSCHTLGSVNSIFADYPLITSGNNFTFLEAYIHNVNKASNTFIAATNRISFPTLVTVPSGQDTMMLRFLATSPGCIDSVAILFNAGNQTLGLNVNPGTQVCSGSSVQLTPALTSVTTPVTYTWSTGATTANVSVAVTSDTLVKLTVTDAQSCVLEDSVSITKLQSVAFTVSQNGPVCQGDSIVLQVNPVVSGATYSWVGPNGFTSTDTVVVIHNATSTMSGAYSVTMTDGTCTSVQTASVVVNSAPLISLNISPISCSYTTDGAVSVTINNGVVPSTYNWSNGGNASSINNLSSGVYTVTVTSVSGCSATATTTLNPPLAVTATAVASDATCSYSCDGSIAVTVSGGAGNYNYIWSGGLGGMQNPSNVCPGAYSVVVSDQNNCTTVAGAIVNSSSGTIALSVSSNAPVCEGSSFTLDASVGFASYTWSGPMGYTNNTASLTITNASQSNAGTYTVTVSNASGCTATSNIYVNLYNSPTPNLSMNPIHCSYSTDGAISAFPNNNASPYAYNWNNGSTTSSISNLTAGTYSVTISDNNGCSASASTIMTAPAAISLTPAPTNATCPSSCNGSISLTGTGGTGGFIYIWSGGLASTATPSNVCPGTYSVLVIDGSGCTASTATTVGSGAAPVVTASAAVTLCTGSSTILTSTAGMTAYNWSGPNGFTSTIASPHINNIVSNQAGNYTVTVTGSNTCTASASTSITVNTSPALAFSHTSITCNGLSNASVTVNASAATPAYTYNWSNGGTNASIANVGVGTYTVTVTSANGCTASGTESVSAPTAITLSATATNATCANTCNGSISLAASGGTGALNYTWSGGLTAIQNPTNVCVGTYNVVVTDANGCSASTSATVNGGASPLVSITPVSALCAGGSASLVATSGLSAYNWTGPNGFTSTIASPSIANITTSQAGTYTVTATGSNTCTASASVSVAVNATPQVNIVSTPISCFGGSDGTFTVVPTGGTTPYTYLWTTGATTQTLSNRGTGSVGVTVTSANGCTAAGGSVLIAPTAITLSPTAVNATCPNTCNGTITLAVSGGTGTFNYSWSGGLSPVQNPTGVCAGTYTVLAVDANGCTASTTSTVGAGAAPTVTITPVPALCAGGVVTLAATAALSAYSWTGPNGFTSASASSTIPNVNTNQAGTYTVTATGSNTCTASASVNVVVNATPQLTLNTTPISCNGVNNGSVTAIASGGVTPYTYTWTNAGTNATISSLAAGIYTVTVTSANACTATATTTLTAPTAISVTATGTNATCPNTCNGSIATTITGGTGGITYSWNGGLSPVQNPTGVCAGAYTVAVADGNGCTASTTVNVGSGAAPSVTITPVSALCAGGTVNLAATASLSAYSWTGPNGFTSAIASPSIANATTNQAGIYTVTATGSNTCTASASVNVVVNATPQLTLNTTPISCNGVNNGSVTAIASGGVTPYTYAWSNAATNASISSLAAGSYTVTVTSTNTCTATATTTLTAPTAISVTATGTNATCPNTCNGSITTVVTGGTGGITYSWNGGLSPVQNPTGVCAGAYAVAVSDGNGCTASTTVNVGSGAAPTVTITPVSALCAGSTVSLPATAVLSTYSWTGPNGFTSTIASPTITNITTSQAGTYTVTATGSNTCTASASVAVTVKSTPVLTITSTPIACNGFNNGVLTVQPTNATAPYTYNWSNAGTNETILNLTANTYSVTVTSANGCTATTSATLSNPTALTVSASGTDATCAYTCEATIASIATGGNGGFTYAWSGGVSPVQNPVGVCAGTYTLVVSDINSCTASTSVTVGAGAAPTVSIAPVAASCTGSNLNLIATSGYAGYNWTGPNNFTSAVFNPTIANASPSQAGIYAVTATGSNTCTASASVNIALSNAPQLVLTSTDIHCNGGADGAIQLSVGGGTSPYTYSWNNGQGTANISGLVAGTYSVTVTSADGCTSSESTTLTDPVLLTVATGTTATTCAYTCDGSITVSSAGGTGTLLYSWSGGLPSIANPVNVCAGNYTVVVSDTRGCIATAQATVSPGASPTVAISAPSSLCEGTTLSLSASGTYSSYNWTGPLAFTSSQQSVSIASVVASQSGVYAVTASDVNGCTASSSATIVVGSIPQLQISGSDAHCFGTSTGSATVAVTGNATPYTFSWTTGATTPAITALATGTYTVTATGANGCSASANVNIGAPAALAITATPTATTCSNTCDGTITTTITGGNSTFTYSWSGGLSPIANPVSVCPGAYTVVVTDNMGCSAIANATVLPGAVQPLTINPVTVCQGDTLFLSTTPVYTGYSWSGPVGFSSSLANPNIPALAAYHSGTYTVTAVAGNGCSATASYYAAVHVSPLIFAIPGVETCLSGNGTANALVSGGTQPYTYLWSNGQATAIASGLSSTGGPYTITVTDNNNCSATSSVTIGNTGTLSALITSNANAICQGQSVTLIAQAQSVNAGTVSYLWASGSTNALISDQPSLSKMYTLTITTSMGCTASASDSITVNTAPVATITGVNTICADSSAVLTASGGVTYQWSTGNTTSTISTQNTGYYSATVLDANGCRDTAYFYLTRLPVIAPPTTNFATTDICTGSTIQLSASGSGTAGHILRWYYNGNLVASSANAVYDTLTTVPVIDSALYTVIEVDPVHGCYSSATAMTIHTHSALAAPASVTDSICTGQQAVILLPATTTGYYEWYDAATGGSLVHTGQLISTPTLTNDLTYYVGISDGQCKSARVPVAVVVMALPALPAVSNSGPACEGDSVVLIASTPVAGTYTWTGPNGYQATGLTSVLHNVATTNSGLYTFTIRTPYGCTVADTTILSINSLITQTGLFGVTSVCENGTVALTADPVTGATYHWTLPDHTVRTTNAPSLLVNQATVSLSGWYYLQVSHGHCTSPIDSTWVTIVPTPTIPLITGNTTVCENDTFSVTLMNPQPGVFYTWVLPGGYVVPSALTFGITNIHTNNSGQFKVYATDGVFCHSDTSTYSLIVNPRPDTTGLAVANNGPLCDGDTLRLNANIPAGYTGEWINAHGQTAQSVIPHAHELADDGNYTFTLVNSATGCRSKPVRSTVLIGSIPPSLPVYNTSPACAGQDVQIYAPYINGATYAWTGPDTFSSDSYHPLLHHVNLSQTGDYSLVITIGSCTSPPVASFVKVNSLPVVNAGVDTTVETTTYLQLHASGDADTYVWAPTNNLNNPYIANPLFLSPLADTFTYYVTGYNSTNTCSSTDTVKVVVTHHRTGENVNLNPSEIITPNGDGQNQYWTIGNIENLVNYEIYIFDRGGMIVYQTKEYHNDWDGTYHGKDLPEGTYWYIIRTPMREYKGAITIIR